MLSQKHEKSKSKNMLHQRNKHRQSYDFKTLCSTNPDLLQFVFVNKYNVETIDFSNPNAVKTLNKALLQHYYNIKYWEIPNNYLCPPIPGRADYIHNIADLLANINGGKIPMGNKILCLDIGTGANCIYPILGNSEYAWSFIASDIDVVALQSAKKIVESNLSLRGKIELKLQKNKSSFFHGIINIDDFVDITICNPPFHASQEEALTGTKRKLRNLNQPENKNTVLNFGGQSNELWCEGGEAGFVKNMIYESKKYSTNCMWFTTLVSKESNLKNIYSELKKLDVADVKIVNMGQGNKVSRLVAWTFLSCEQQKKWAKIKWK
jgi:23S rRNA (adenine1618-N6)-methyltransferase